MSAKLQVKSSGAYYRRKLPLFQKVKEIIQSDQLGTISLISIRLLLPRKLDGIAQTDFNWRIDPQFSGGGLFHDLAPHMLDIIYWIFGIPIHFTGKSLNQGKAYDAPDFTYLNATFSHNIALNGIWSFHMPPSEKEDTCHIIGEKGSLKFSFFDLNPLEVRSESNLEYFEFINPENIQLNMIRDVVRYFRGEGENPCSIEDALVSMQMIDCASK
jgi:1,5-anhydro-D-fructose reductase (1,5-anhydro-D-mannitol-forming)